MIRATVRRLPANPSLEGPKTPFDRGKAEEPEIFLHTIVPVGIKPDVGRTMGNISLMIGPPENTSNRGRVEYGRFVHPSVPKGTQCNPTHGGPVATFFVKLIPKVVLTIGRIGGDSRLTEVVPGRFNKEPQPLVSWPTHSMAAG